METPSRKLMWSGMFLFLLGLITGFFEERFTNMRMGLSAHLEGVMNGTFLLAVGAIWTEARLSSRASAVTYWALLVGTYGNWAVTTIAAVLGTVALSPVTAAGRTAAAQWQEVLVTAGFISVGLAIILASALLLWPSRNSK